MNSEKTLLTGGATMETEDSFNAEEVREEIKKLRDEAVKQHEAEIKDQKKIKNNIHRHLVKLSNEDIAKIPEEQLKMWVEVKNLDKMTEEDYDFWSKKISKFTNHDMPTGEDVVIDTKDAYRKASIGIRSLIINTLLKKMEDSGLFEKKQAVKNK